MHATLQARLDAQGLDHPLASPEAVVRHLTAVQAQDLNAALVAVALRTAGGTAEAVGRALDEGRLLRTHLLRPTWHLVAAEDLRWLMRLTAGRLLQGAAGRFRDQGLTPERRELSRQVLRDRLASGFATRDELRVTFAAHGLPSEGQPFLHLLIDAEWNLVVCSGPRHGAETSYALVEHRAPEAAQGDEVTLAQRYLAGHGPASAEDFSWWSGLALGTARRALAGLPPPPEVLRPSAKRFHWLPAFDEYVIAFADRSALFDDEHRDRVLSKNGIFWPVILDQGRVAGTWKAVAIRDRWTIQADWFSPPDDAMEAARQAWEREYAALRG